MNIIVWSGESFRDYLDLDDKNLDRPYLKVIQVEIHCGGETFRGFLG